MEWRPVVGFKGVYEVSDDGAVRGLDRIDAGGRRWRGRILSSERTDKDGYVQQTLCRGGIRRNAKTHILVLEAFVGLRPPGAVGRHLDGNPRNNALHNLVWGTSSENAYDRVTHGRHHETLKAYCRRDHPLVAPNLVTSRLPTRVCLACARAFAHLQRNPDGDLRAVADRYYSALMVSHTL
jgi:hypothetical protein